MKEVKQPSKKPLVYYYLVALLILMVLNLTLFPAMLETPVQDVTYDQFMSMTYEQNVGQVQIEGMRSPYRQDQREGLPHHRHQRP